MTSIEKRFKQLEQELQSTLSQLNHLEGKVVQPLSKQSLPTLKELFFKEEGRLAFDTEATSSNGDNAYEQYYNENLKVMLERYKATSNFYSQVFVLKWDLARWVCSCMANSFETLVNEKWEELVTEYEDIVKGMVIPHALFATLRELIQYYKKTMPDETKVQQFLQTMKDLPEDMRDMNERLSSSMRALMKKAKNLDPEDRESVSDLRRAFKSFVKQENRRRNEYDRKYGKLDTMVTIMTGLYERLNAFSRELHSEDVKSFNKSWSELDEFLGDAEERLDTMFEIPTILQVVYSQDDNNINTLQLTVEGMFKNMRRLKPIWKQLYRLRKNETLENVEDSYELLQLFATGWKDHMDYLDTFYEEMRDLKKQFKSSSALSNYAENISEKKKQLTDKLSKIFESSESREDRKLQKEQQKKQAKLSGKEQKIMERMERERKEQERKEGVSSGKVLMRGVENIRKDVVETVGIDGINVDAVTQPVKGIGSKIKDTFKLPFGGRKYKVFGGEQ
jgi:uncharacterized protein YukE